MEEGGVADIMGEHQGETNVLVDSVEGHLQDCHNDELQNGHFPEDNAERDEDRGSRKLSQQEAVESQPDHGGVGTSSPQLDKPRG